MNKQAAAKLAKSWWQSLAFKQRKHLADYCRLQSNEAITRYWLRNAATGQQLSQLNQTEHHV